MSAGIYLKLVITKNFSRPKVLTPPCISLGLDEYVQKKLDPHFLVVEVLNANLLPNGKRILDKFESSKSGVLNKHAN